MEVDQQLLQELELAVDGANVHRFYNLRGIYLGSVKQFKLTGEKDWEDFASEVEADLRVILTKHRYLRAGLAPE